jgi:RNase adaptor protein for sRNA GlmZ degradation
MKDTKSITVIESIKHELSMFEIWDNGIIYLQIDDNVCLELKHSKEHDDFLLNRFDGINRHKILVESGMYSSISPEARKHSTKQHESDMIDVVAIIAKSLADKILINFAIKMSKQKTMKMKMFDDKQKAVEWLLSHK